ncbi:MAG: AsmA-like C-terminal domain-containing protein [Desulfobacteraceae bacterium]|jgi:hypothetical protein|nr:AsmA-like C-terminal domain-containing protein [Desulfobacteraceae bacterium]
MSNIKKITPWLIRILVVFTILIVLAIVLSPRLINLEMVRSQVEHRMSRDVGAEIKYRKMVLSYFPRPHIVIHKAEIQIPGSFTIKVHRMRFFPRILPLFRGVLEVSSVRLEYAEYFMKLPRISETTAQPGAIVSVDSIVKGVARAVKSLPEFKLPDVRLFVKYGSVNLVDPVGRKFMLREVQADYHPRPDRLEFSITCKSNLWDQININGFLNPIDFRGRGKVQLSRLRPQNLLAYLMPKSKLQVLDTRANLNIDFESQGVGSLRADFDGAIPFLELGNDTQKLAFKGGRFRGAIGIGDSAITIKLAELGLDYPQLTATGMFSYNEDQDDLRLDINGAEINAASVRQMALALAGESEIIRDIFDIIRGGHVPSMSFQTHGHSMAELGRLENIVIKGRMTQGKIFIPGVELDLEDVIGDAVISEGILNGVNLQARMGQTRGQKGTLRLGLNEAIAPLKLKIGVEADLAQLPPVLSRIVDDTDFINELAKITDVKGSASGVLILGDELKSLGATVEVSKADFSARYDRVPFPIILKGGHFVYEDSRIAIEKFDADIGKSTLRQFSSAIDWSGTPILNFKTHSATLNLEQIYSWLLTFENYKESLSYIHTLDGNVGVEEVSINGPFFNPRVWEFIFRGNLNNLKIDSNRLPRPLYIEKGQFSSNPAGFALTDIDASLGKSKVSQLSANFKRNKETTFDLQSKSINLFAGEFYPWLSSQERFKPALEDFKVTSGNLILLDLVLSGPVHEPGRWHYQVDGDMQSLAVSSDAFVTPVTVNKGSFELTTATGLIGDVPGKRIKFDPTKLTWGNSRLTFNGDISLQEKDIHLASTVSADEVDWTQITSLLDYIKKKGETNQGQPARDGNVLGTLKVITDKFIYDTYSVQPLRAQIAFKPETTTINIDQASVCDVDLRGLLDVNEQNLEIYLVPTAVDQNLATAVACFTGEKKTATGTFSLSGELLSNGKPETFGQSLAGHVAFSAKEGRIYRLGLLAKILSILNVTEIYRGEVPDLTGQGFAYRSITAYAQFKGSKLILKECSIDGVSMGIACDGDIDLVEKKMNLTVLVAPFKTVDRIVDIIPLVGHVLGGKLISIPFKAKGDLRDPDVIPLPPVAVGAGVLGILERTLKLPITVIQPIFPGGKTKNKEPQRP